jgi:GntR family transcriptional repressor for pyruvate dehydrogenase complex
LFVKADTMSGIIELLTELNNSDKQITAVEKVSEYIKNKIIYRELHAGDKIPTETELCQILGVSRSSVREALKILESSNIIKIRRGDGTYISKSNEITFSNPLLFKMILSNMTLRELFDFREQMEFSIIKLAITYAEDSDIACLRGSYERMSECVQKTPEDSEKLFLLDIEFHRILAHATKNILMKELYFFTMDIFSPIIHGNYKIGQGGASTLMTHEAAIKAVEKRDFLEAAHAVKLALGLWGEWINKQGKQF